MSYREIAPGARLANYVECFWSWEDDAVEKRHVVLPDGCADVLFEKQAGEPVSLNAVGLMTVPLDAPTVAKRTLFGARFRPAMAACFFPEMAALTDCVQPLEEVVGRAGRSLFERLSDTDTLDEMTRVMASALRPLEAPAAGDWALRALAAGEALDEVLRHAGIGARQLRRVCLERSGVSPKYLSRILRFRRAVEFGDRAAGGAGGRAQISWAQLAASCGYYDQAHLIRDFQEFAGATPVRFFQSRADGNRDNPGHERYQTEPSD